VDADFESIPKPSHRERLLTAGLQVVFEQGYCGASVRDIVQAAWVPQGSFINYFRSKEAFCRRLRGDSLCRRLRDDSLCFWFSGGGEGRHALDEHAQNATPLRK
jgi:AcrR family transcriptional regulator